MYSEFKRHLILLFLSSIFTAAQCSSDIKALEQNWFPSEKTLKQRLFSKDELHHLNVTQVGKLTVSDLLDCIVECLKNALCLSINMTAFKGAEGKLWCELLSSDKYRDIKNYKENMSSHHFSLLSPCSSWPCQNGGICIPNYKYNSYQCLCEPGFMGEFCEKAITSCKALYDFKRSNVSELVTLRLDSKPVSVLCHMGDFGCGNGGWTPVMKIDGIKNTFHYNNPYWSNKIEYNIPGGESGFDSRETKLPTYWNTTFSKICLGMKIGQQLRFTVIDRKADSLYSLIADGEYRAISLGRETWKSLIGSDASLQLNCNKEGFNTADVNRFNAYHSEARIGIIANQENDCRSCDSRIGFGTGGYLEDGVVCGNVAYVRGDNGDRRTPGMGYILVQ
ncbi:uncharacterized protein LOC113666295 [Pocillopora damicornis]|uniref:uncharacterized protein LOC113666295 n=1 Tax=Pocillopora damicornis TaxID=46731 RepID=UPI000F555071|nr:uncharacterized protein LOC113666295 [Pocillopora damicornis]